MCDDKFKISNDDELDPDTLAFINAAAIDTLKALGPISKEEADYYNKL